MGKTRHVQAVMTEHEAKLVLELIEDELEFLNDLSYIEHDERPALERAADKMKAALAKINASLDDL